MEDLSSIIKFHIFKISLTLFRVDKLYITFQAMVHLPILIIELEAFTFVGNIFYQASFTFVWSVTLKFLE